MQKEKSYKKELACFLDYYKEQCQKFMSNHSEDFSGSYFSEWYKTTCRTTLQTIKDSICDARLDERVSGFIELYKFYIGLAQQQENDELLLENLFIIPTRMQSEFFAFGFLVTEVVVDEQDWWDESVDIQNQGIRGTSCSCQYFLESDLNNRALSFY